MWWIILWDSLVIFRRDIWSHSNWPTWCTKLCFIISLLDASTWSEHCCAHHQMVKTVLYSIWYRHTCRRPSGAQVGRRLLSTCAPDGHLQVWRYQMLYNTVLTFWWRAQQCSKHEEAYNKLIIKQDFVHQICGLRKKYLTSYCCAS